MLILVAVVTYCGSAQYCRWAGELSLSMFYRCFIVTLLISHTCSRLSSAWQAEKERRTNSMLFGVAACWEIDCVLPRRRTTAVRRTVRQFKGAVQITQRSAVITYNLSQRRSLMTYGVELSEWRLDVSWGVGVNIQHIAVKSLAMRDAWLYQADHVSVSISVKKLSSLKLLVKTTW